MQNFLASVKEKARALNKTIVFPESFDDRTLQAIEVILKEQLAHPILLGNKTKIQGQSSDLKLDIDWNKATILDNSRTDLKKKYAEKLYEMRKNKGMTLEKAYKTIEDYNYFGVMMVEMEEADGMISGAAGSTGGTILPALQIIKTKEKFHKVSGIFFMILEKRLLLFADCGVNIDPNSHDLADIAIDTAENAKRFGITPKIAMLSFSTNKSADHPYVDKVREAVAIIKDRRPDLIIDGEMQVDAALVSQIAERKFPGSAIKGDANILIFPDLQSGNIAYKLVERLAGAQAIGPILQGLRKPVNDLSRGCSYMDIVNLTAITACEAQDMDYEIKQ